MLNGKVLTYPKAMIVSVNHGLLNNAAVDKAIRTIRGSTNLWGIWTFFKVIVGIELIIKRATPNKIAPQKKGLMIKS